MVDASERWGKEVLTDRTQVYRVGRTFSHCGMGEKEGQKEEVLRVRMVLLVHR